MKIKDLLNEDVKGLLSEESLTAIQNAFDQKVVLAVEQALDEQDATYTEKLQSLVNAIDKDHSVKMQRVMESVDKDRAGKLVKLVKLYEKDLKKDATSYKKTLIGNISSYLDEYLEECVSADDIKAAVRNKTAYHTLENMRNLLVVDTVAQNKQIRGAVLESKATLTKLEKENAELKKQFKALYENHQKTQKDLLFESKLSSITDEKKKEFIKKTFDGKSLKFIEENFDYVTRLFDKTEKQTMKIIREEAIENRKVKPDFVKAPEKVVTENVNNNDDQVDPYVNALSQVRKFS